LASTSSTSSDEASGAETPVTALKQGYISKVVMLYGVLFLSYVIEKTGLIVLACSPRIAHIEMHHNRAIFYPLEGRVFNRISH
jgi:hypothetical protein